MYIVYNIAVFTVNSSFGFEDSIKTGQRYTVLEEKLLHALYK
jgi:hypothetical protein